MKNNNTYEEKSGDFNKIKNNQLYELLYSAMATTDSKLGFQAAFLGIGITVLTAIFSFLDSPFSKHIIEAIFLFIFLFLFLIALLLTIFGIWSIVNNEYSLNKIMKKLNVILQTKKQGKGKIDYFWFADIIKNFENKEHYSNCFKKHYKDEKFTIEDVLMLQKIFTVSHILVRKQIWLKVSIIITILPFYLVFVFYKFFIFVFKFTKK